MPYDKIVDSAVLDAKLTEIANAIRSKTGSTEPLSFWNGMTDLIESIEAGGGSLIAAGSITPASNGAITITQFR